MTNNPWQTSWLMQSSFLEITCSRARSISVTFLNSFLCKSYGRKIDIFGKTDQNDYIRSIITQKSTWKVNSNPLAHILSKNVKPPHTQCLIREWKRNGSTVDIHSTTCYAYSNIYRTHSNVTSLHEFYISSAVGRYFLIRSFIHSFSEHEQSLKSSPELPSHSNHSS